ncbi:hypothetical protein [Streptacidiphilus sp. EB103A]|uniref:hypothetical protein n=1 Tax=Streptacidiphilus sp. EB103A TaxID=3156275 RepID=UPI0035138E8D
MTSPASAEEPTEQNIRARFAELPEQITRQQIAHATFRAPVSVQNWINKKSLEFPPALNTDVPKGKTQYRSRDAVRDWYFRQSFAVGENRGRPAGATTTRPAPTQTKALDAVRQAFADLPAFVDVQQIADATGRTRYAVHNWILEAGFPAAVPDPALTEEQAAELSTRGGELRFRDRDAVLAWYEDRFPDEQVFGPGDSAQAALSMDVRLERVSVRKLAELFGVTLKGAYLWTEADLGSDPFPPVDDTARREWAAVRSWMLRKTDPMPKVAEEQLEAWMRAHTGTSIVGTGVADKHRATSQAHLEKWVLRNMRAKGPGTRVKDQYGLSIGHRDVIERARVANAAGRTVSAEWVAEKLGLTAERVAELLELTATPGPAPRQRLSTLARDFGLNEPNLRYLASRYREGEDPFPAPVDHLYDEEAVRSWLERRNILTPAETPTGPEAGEA